MNNNNASYDNYYDFSPSQNNRNDELNYQHSPDTISHHNHCVNTAASGSGTFGFYFPLNGRLYYVTYTELNQHEIARRLNNGINDIYTPNYPFPHHFNVQNSIQQQIAQQHCNCNCNCNRQGIQPPSFNNPYVKSISSNMQNTGFEVPLQQNNYQQY